MKKLFLIALLSLILVETSFAAEDLTEVLNRITGHGPAILKAITVGAALFGAWLVVYAVGTVWRLGKGSMGQVSRGNPLFAFIGGMGLIYIMAVVGIGGVTLFDRAKPVGVEGVEQISIR